jgi:hypothetical protein
MGCTRQLSNHLRVVPFTTYRRTVFAIERYVKDATCELLGHLALQRKAFQHLCLLATIMVTDR